MPDDDGQPTPADYLAKNIADSGPFAISMTPAQFEAWMLALTDGSHSQADGMLARTDELVPGGVRYCCLGVYCHVRGLDLWTPITDYIAPADDFDLDGPHEPRLPARMSGGDTAPDVLADELDNLELRGLLAQANDDGATFDQIAHALRDAVEQGHIILSTGDTP